MYSIATNLVAFLIYVMTMLVEYILFNLFGLPYTTTWLITTLLYVVFIIYQIIARLNEDFEKNKIKQILGEIIDTIDGIPFVNKNEKMHIQWDVVFKRLIDNKANQLYDKIINLKTVHIEQYINKYPSILLDSNIDLIEGKRSFNNLSSFIMGKGEKREMELPDLVENEDFKKRLLIKELSVNRAEFSNYDASIIVNVLLIDEFEPEDYEKRKIAPDPRFDGFSVVLLYKDRKYTVVPKVMVYNKHIDKERWFFRHVEKLLQLANGIVADEQVSAIVPDEGSLKEYLTDNMNNMGDGGNSFYLYRIEDNKIVFVGLVKGSETTKAYCELITNHNGFELNLVRYEIIKEDKKEIVETQQTVVIGSSYQPIITLLEKMPFVSRNISLLVQNKELTDIVIR